MFWFYDELQVKSSTGIIQPPSSSNRTYSVAKLVSDGPPVSAWTTLIQVLWKPQEGQTGTREHKLGSTQGILILLTLQHIGSGVVCLTNSCVSPVLSPTQELGCTSSPEQAFWRPRGDSSSGKRTPSTGLQASFVWRSLSEYPPPILF